MIGFSLATAILMMAAPSSGEEMTKAKQRDEVRKACMADVMRLCPREAAARDRQGVRACLKAKVSKTSQECQSRLQAAAAERGPQGDSGRPRSPDRSAPPIPKP